MAAAAFPSSSVTVRRIPPVVVPAAHRMEDHAAHHRPPYTGAVPGSPHAAEAERILPRLEKFVYFLDMAWGIPGTSLRFGADSLIGLIPIAGDIVMLLTSLTIVLYAIKWRLRWSIVLLMLLYCVIDLTIGLVPVVGDVGDTLFKANVYNYRLLKIHRPR